MTDRLLKLPEVLRLVGLGKTAVYDMIREKRFPAAYVLSSRCVRWKESEIRAWIDALPASPGRLGRH